MNLQQPPNYNYPWPILKVVLEGSSILDVPRLELKTMEEATGFIQAYGFDPSSQDDVELLWGFFEDAISFIERSLADPLHPKIPEHLRTRKSVSDLRRLLLMASERTGNPDQLYSCAILRVMHVIIHISFDPRLKFYLQMQSQVLSRLDKFLYSDPATGATYLGKSNEGGGGIKLLYFKKKERKDRDREIIKLLHKAESVVEEIYDRVGIRLVTETKFEAIKAVKLLLEKNIISLPNVRPGRSRNRLIDLKRLTFEIDRINVHISKNVDAPYVEKLIKRLESRIGTRRLGRSLINPHSSEHYRAIQFTCRELVKINNSEYQTYSAVKQHLTGIPGGNELLSEIFPVVPPKSQFGFFPYEIQIMDVKAYADSIFGKSNHEEYRRKQVESARARVFGREAPELD